MMLCDGLPVLEILVGEFWGVESVEVSAFAQETVSIVGQVVL